MQANILERDNDSTVLDMLSLGLRYRRVLLGIPLALGALAFAFFAVFGSYTSESTFSPEASAGSLSGLAGLAAQFGATVPAGIAGGTSESADFYSSLAKSPQLLAELARTEYAFAKSIGGSDSTRGNLIELYGISGDSDDERLEKIIDKLDGRIVVSVDRLAGVITVRVKAPAPSLAQQVNRRLLELLNRFNLEQRQGAASAQRRFVQGRVDSARRELDSAEDSLERFLLANRTYQSSPRLALEAARLQRRIDLRQGVFVTLTQAFEQARIEEVRNTPVITVIQQPDLYWKRSRKPLTMGLVAFVLGCAMAGGFAVFAEHFRRVKETSPEKYGAMLESIPTFIRRRLRV